MCVCVCVCVCFDSVSDSVPAVYTSVDTPGPWVFIAGFVRSTVHRPTGFTAVSRTDKWPMRMHRQGDSHIDIEIHID